MKPIVPKAIFWSALIALLLVFIGVSAHDWFFVREPGNRLVKAMIFDANFLTVAWFYIGFGTYCAFVEAVGRKDLANGTRVRDHVLPCFGKYMTLVFLIFAGFYLVSLPNPIAFIFAFVYIFAASVYLGFVGFLSIFGV